MEIEFASWVAARFREEERATLAQVEAQLLSRHKELEKELTVMFKTALLDAGKKFSKTSWLHQNPPPIVKGEGADDKPTSPVNRCQSLERQASQESTYTSIDTHDIMLDIPAVAQSVSERNVSAVIDLLNMRADPNSILEEYRLRGRKYTPCSVLGIAVLQNEVEMVRTLLRGNADPDSVYGMATGAKGMLWSGPCGGAAVFRNNLEMLKLLIEAAADPQRQSSNGSTLIWEAAYHGRVDIASYLLSMDITIDIPAAHPDFDGVSHTPLHVGILRGHNAIVSQLLSEKAETFRCNEIGRAPLDDAIISCQPNMVSILVGKGASVSDDKSEQAFGGRITSNGFETMRPIDRAIAMNNSVVMAALAEGLGRQEDQVRRLELRDIIHFLNATGDAPGNILKAVFRHRKVVYWKQNYVEKDNTLDRTSITTAFIKKPEVNGLFEHINVSVMSNSYSDLASKLKAKLPLDQNELQHIERLAPQTEFHHNAVMSSVSLYECLISDVHVHLGVIAAIANLDNRTLTLKPCQAILQLCWNAVKRQSFFDVLVHAALMLDFIAIGVLLQRKVDVKLDDRLENDQILRVVAACGLVFSVIHFVAELLQCVAFYFQGWLGKYLSDFGNYIDWGRIAGDNIVLILVFVYGSDLGDGASNTRVVLAILAFYKWIKFMSALTPFRTFGPSILPILEATRGAGPFLVVLSLCSLGLWHAYITLEPGRLDYFQSWFMVYRLSLFADWEATELSGAEAGYAVQTFYMIASLMITVTLMNVFIAALGASFENSTANMVPLFERRRAQAILSNMAVREGIRYMTRWSKQADSKNHILWFSCAAQDSPD